MARSTENTDLLNRELDGVLDFSKVALGGLAMVEPVTEREFKNDEAGRSAYEAFMKEPVVIRIHPAQSPNEPIAAEVGLNGSTVVIPRDKRVRLPRAFVEILARSQARTFKQERNPNPMADEGMVTRRHTYSSYAFEVLHDPNPKGPSWLRRVIHESA